MERSYKRRQYFIDPAFQAYFILRFCLVVIIASAAMGGAIFYLSRSSTTVAIENTKVVVKSTADFILPILSITALTVLVFSALAVLVLTLVLSHRIMGPIYRIRREIEGFKNGDLTRDFHVRSKDQMQALAESLTLMAGTLKEKHVVLKQQVQVLAQYLQEKNFSLSAQDGDPVGRMIKEIQSTLDYFKVS